MLVLAHFTPVEGGLMALVFALGAAAGLAVGYALGWYVASRKRTQ